jgi:hypothetical protein
LYASNYFASLIGVNMALQLAQLFYEVKETKKVRMMVPYSTTTIYHACKA